MNHYLINVLHGDTRVAVKLQLTVALINRAAVGLQLNNSGQGDSESNGDGKRSLIRAWPEVYTAI